MLQRLFNRKIVGVILVFGLIGIGLFLYLLFLEPLVSILFIPHRGIHDGLEYYETKQYLEFEHGELLDDALLYHHSITGSNIVDFYHIDNKQYDNLITGSRYNDAFAVDYRLNESAYLDSKQYVESNYLSCTSIDDFQLYLSDYSSSESGHVVVVSLCDADYTVRCILIADIDEVPQIESSSYNTFLHRYTSLNWRVERTGDGSLS